MVRRERFVEDGDSPPSLIPPKFESILQPLVEEGPKTVRLTEERVKEMVASVYSYYRKFSKEGDRKALRYAAGIAFQLRDLAYAGKISLSRVDIGKFNAIIAENIRDYTNNILGDIIY